MSTATISKIRIYPIKSLGHVEIDTAPIGTHSLKNDRIYAMIDHIGRYINGKRTNRVQLLHTEFNLAENTIGLSDKEGGDNEIFELREDNEALDAYLSNFFDIKLNLRRNDDGGFQDIPTESSLTIVSEASLRALQSNLDRHNLENIRRRFRSNIELSNVESYWEESLYQEHGVGMRFMLGDVEMLGISPRARCNVPPQDPNTGVMDYEFVQNMIQRRKEHSETADKLKQFGRNPYFLTINVFIPKTETNKILNLHDEIKFIEPVQLNTSNWKTLQKYF